MQREHLPLLLASGYFAKTDEAEPLDHLRMQKGIFLLINAGNPEWHDLFFYTPYDWGPYSNDLAQLIHDLCNSGLLKRESFPNRKYLQYRTTSRGERIVYEVLQTLSDADGIYIRSVRHYVTSRPFARLLREIYKAYPEYAVNSRFAS